MTALLTLEALSLGYGRRAVLSALSPAPFPSGSLVGILGPNGAGKSTLLRALSGLIPYRGTARLAGESLCDMAPARRAASVGYLPQMLPQGTTLVAYEAVVSAYRAVHPEAARAAVEAAAEATFDRLGIRDLAFRPLTEMSGGQRQMIGLAQVLVRRPRLLLLDEPTSALDLKWQLTVLAVIRRIVAEEGGLCLIALHDINLAMRHCDRVALFGDGRLLADGAPVEALTPAAIAAAFGVAGRIERSTEGTPFVVVDEAGAGSGASDAAR